MICLLQANLWIAIFSYVGNYFWTHYFFTVLGASYTFPSWRMNNVSEQTNDANFLLVFPYINLWVMLYRVLLPLLYWLLSGHWQSLELKIDSISLHFWQIRSWNSFFTVNHLQITASWLKINVYFRAPFTVCMFLHFWWKDSALIDVFKNFGCEIATKLMFCHTSWFFLMSFNLPFLVFFWASRWTNIPLDRK